MLLRLGLRWSRIFVPLLLHSSASTASCTTRGVGVRAVVDNVVVVPIGRCMGQLRLGVGSGSLRSVNNLEDHVVY